MRSLLGAYYRVPLSLRPYHYHGRDASLTNAVLQPGTARVRLLTPTRPAPCARRDHACNGVLRGGKPAYRRAPGLISRR